MSNANLDSWDGFTSGMFLKASDVNSDADAFPCIGADVVSDRDTQKSKIQLTLERNGKTYKFDLNQANLKALKASAPNPKAVIGKKIYFRKVLVTNPKTKQEVDGLRITRID